MADGTFDKLTVKQFYLVDATGNRRIQMSLGGGNQVVIDLQNSDGSKTVVELVGADTGAGLTLRFYQGNVPYSVFISASDDNPSVKLFGKDKTVTLDKNGVAIAPAPASGKGNQSCP